LEAQVLFDFFQLGKVPSLPFRAAQSIVEGIVVGFKRASIMIHPINEPTGKRETGT